MEVMEMRTAKLLFLPILLLLMSCAAQHPGAVNPFDSSTYDSLLATHGIIEQTKTDLANNAIPANLVPGVKNALNLLITAYNVTDAAYQAYHAALTTGTATSTQQADVQTKLSNMTTAQNALVSAKTGGQ